MSATVLSEGFEPPQAFRPSDLQSDAIDRSANSAHRKLILEPPLGFGPRTFTLQKYCSTTELRRLV